MKKEKIIVRREYDPYKKKWGYLVGFPEQEANRGNILCVPCCTNSFGHWECECSCEVDLNYFRNKKIVHKNTADAQAVKGAIELIFGDGFEVVEKIVKGMEVY